MKIRCGSSRRYIFTVTWKGGEAEMSAEQVRICQVLGWKKEKLTYLDIYILTTTILSKQLD